MAPVSQHAHYGKLVCRWSYVNVVFAAREQPVSSALQDTQLGCIMGHVGSSAFVFGAWDILGRKSRDISTSAALDLVIFLKSVSSKSPKFIKVQDQIILWCEPNIYQIWLGRSDVHLHADLWHETLVISCLGPLVWPACTPSLHSCSWIHWGDLACCCMNC